MLTDFDQGQPDAARYDGIGNATQCRITPRRERRCSDLGQHRRTIMGSKTDKITGRIKEAVGVLTDTDNLEKERQRGQEVGEMQDA